MAKKQLVEQLGKHFQSNPIALQEFLSQIHDQCPKTRGIMHRYLKESSKEILIPLECFSSSRTILQSVVLYLKDHNHLSNRRIGILLNRSTKTIWESYRVATKNTTGPTVSSGNRCVPVSVFADAKPLRALVVFCREILHMKNSAIAHVLHRDARTISSTYAHAQRGDAV